MGAAESNPVRNMDKRTARRTYRAEFEEAIRLYRCSPKVAAEHAQLAMAAGAADDDAADDAQMREKMAKDMVLVMLCERASLPASFNEITAKMADVGWRRPPAQWQRVARELYEGETITVAQNSRGDIFEVWF